MSPVLADRFFIICTSWEAHSCTNVHNCIRFVATSTSTQNVSITPKCFLLPTVADAQTLPHGTLICFLP